VRVHWWVVRGFYVGSNMSETTWWVTWLILA